MNGIVPVKQIGDGSVQVFRRIGGQIDREIEFQELSTIRTVFVLPAVATV
jgi:hypothetical protein